MYRVDHNPELPRWAITRWLVATNEEVPEDLRPALILGLYGSIPIFLGGVFNTLIVSALIALRNPALPFMIWAAVELCLAILRLPLLIIGLRAARRGGRAYTDLYLMLAVAWAASVGYGCFITMVSGDWVAATLACLSAAAMAGGIAFRNFSAPRLVAVMILFSIGPCVAGGLLSGEPILCITALQIPAYIGAMCAAAYRINGLLVQTMRSERENKHLARHDALTGLLNRVGLEEEIARRARRAARERHATLFYLDLDGFKGVNDQLGHAAGDRLLQMVAERLRACVRPGDAIARIGGDEFVILSGHGDRAAGFRAGQRIVTRLSEPPYFIGDEAVIIGASVGIAMLPEHGDNFTALLLAADQALYEAKSQGGLRSAIAWLPDTGPHPAEGELQPYELTHQLAAARRQRQAR